MASYSEYGQLRKVLLGTIEDYKPSCWAWKAQPNVNAEDFANAVAICDAAIPSQIMDEVSEDLLHYELALKSLGVDVIRPPRISDEPIYETDVLYSFGRDFYNIRDLHIVFGERIVSSAPSQPNRILEIIELRDFVAKVASELGLAYIACPTPRLKTNPVYPNVRNSSGDLEFTEEVLAANLGSITQEIWHRLTENEILFDAANIVRYNGQALYLVSSTGNMKAFDWLKMNIPDFNFHMTDVYRSSHIDSTILPLDEETFLVNSVRVNTSNIPQSIRDKKILYFNDVARIPDTEIVFHQQYRATAAAQLESLGFQSNLQDMSSPWAGMNVLSINTKTVMVESNQIQLIRFLESSGFEVVPIRMRHAYTMLGGLHCTTLDLARD
jgi:glycine amidinotransferase/scyllo-inosamine-4-phosphate amidinotransferase 1